MSYPSSDITVFDIEADGFLEDSKSIHCISIKHVSPNLSYHDNLYGDLLSRDNVYEHLVAKKCPIIGHNIIYYDIPMIKKFYGIDLVKELGRENIIDTLIMSQTLFPDRKLPIGCPTSVKNPVTKRLDKVTPHSLEAWGYRVSNKKIEIYDWRVFSEEILKRCFIDVEINYKTYLQLLKEANLL